MQGKHLYEYAVIRIMPRVEREEFFNVGVILYCSATKFLDVEYFIDPARVAAFKLDLQMTNIENYVRGFQLLARGVKGCGPIAEFSPAERFRWLTATRSTVLQASKVHPGFCEDPAEKLHDLFGKLVLSIE